VVLLCAWGVRIGRDLGLPGSNSFEGTPYALPMTEEEEQRGILCKYT
jgi:hypothetical protein